MNLSAQLQRLISDLQTRDIIPSKNSKQTIKVLFSLPRRTGIATNKLSFEKDKIGMQILYSILFILHTQIQKIGGGEGSEEESDKVLPFQNPYPGKSRGRTAPPPPPHWICACNTPSR